MSLIKTTAELQLHIAVPGSLDWDLVLPYIGHAERRYIKPLIGADELAAIEAATEGKPKEVQKILATSVANFALLMAMPIISISFSNSGILTSNNSDTGQAQWWQVKDLKRSFQTAGYGALDDALEIMEANATDFADWKDSDYYTEFKELLVHTTKVFQKWFDISNSRRTFIALRSKLAEVEEQYLLPFLKDATLQQLKDYSDDDADIKRVVELCQKAAVAYTIAKVADMTTFKVTASGLFYRWEELPGEKAEIINATILERTRQQKQVAGDKYLMIAKKIIEANTEKFPDYEIIETTISSRIVKHDSGLAT